MHFLASRFCIWINISLKFGGWGWGCSWWWWMCCPVASPKVSVDQVKHGATLEGWRDSQLAQETRSVRADFRTLHPGPWTYNPAFLFLWKWYIFQTGINPTGTGYEVAVFWLIVIRGSERWVLTRSVLPPLLLVASSIMKGCWINGSWLALAQVLGLLHKYHNTPVPYRTMHHFVKEMCTCVHISVTKWCIVG